MEHNIRTIDGLKNFCKDLRKFDTQYVLNNKLDKINRFFRDEGLDSAVVGISGGIDSALVVKLLIEASKQYNSPIRRVLGVFMPIHMSGGTTGQDAAEMYVNALNFGINQTAIYKYKKLDLTQIANRYHGLINLSNNWVQGQIDSIIRTPALYGCAADLQSEGFKSIVVGTTNRDEGAYIGFYGKASDGMVDLQPIADLHKSEVMALAHALNINKDIISRPPEGNVHDGKLDEDMFGAPYWVLEMYQILMENNATYLINYVKDCDELKTWIMNIEIQHDKNKHKYAVGSPARYVDVMKRII